MVHIEGVSRANFGCSILGNGRVKVQNKFGWICPHCSKSYAPFIQECKTCNSGISLESSQLRNPYDGKPFQEISSNLQGKNIDESY